MLQVLYNIISPNPLLLQQQHNAGSALPPRHAILRGNTMPVNTWSQLCMCRQRPVPLSGQLLAALGERSNSSTVSVEGVCLAGRCVAKVSVAAYL